MRPIRQIADQEENTRIVELWPGVVTAKRDPVEREPVGTIVLLPFRIVGYDQDCDGSLMARLENLYFDKGKITPSGWNPKHIGMYSGLVASEEELTRLLGDAKDDES